MTRKAKTLRAAQINYDRLRRQYQPNESPVIAIEGLNVLAMVLQMLPDPVRPDEMEAQLEILDRMEHWIEASNVESTRQACFELESAAFDLITQRLEKFLSARWMHPGTQRLGDWMVQKVGETGAAEFRHAPLP